MAELKKYLFDNFVVDISKNKEDVIDTQQEVEDIIEEPQTETAEQKEVVPPKENLMSQEQIDAQIQKAANEGYNKGLQQAQEAEQKQEVLLMQALSTQLQELLKAGDNTNEGLEQNMQSLGLLMLEKLVPTLQQQEADNIIEKFLSDNFQSFKAEKKITIHLNPKNIEKASNVIAKLANKNDFEGKISIIKDESLSELDCKVMWDYGGVALNQEENTKAIQEIIKA